MKAQEPASLVQELNFSKLICWEFAFYWHILINYFFRVMITDSIDLEKPKFSKSKGIVIIRHLRKAGSMSFCFMVHQYLVRIIRINIRKFHHIHIGDQCYT